MTKETRTAWTVAAVMGVLVIILLGILAHDWYQRQHDLGYVLEDNKDAMVNQREEIREKCSNQTGEASPACQAALQELSDLLTEFGADINRYQRATSTEADIGGQ